jgi:hypothetical protein
MKTSRPSGIALPINTITLLEAFRFCDCHGRGCRLLRDVILPFGYGASNGVAQQIAASAPPTTPVAMRGRSRMASAPRRRGMKRRTRPGIVGELHVVGTL